ncbi:hypothetical protein R1sor_023360 [Riccia sorocarpa]|uniref:Phosphatidylethanolamine-binding protein n=1 Tax=Riccia sorocarpa TaxID=122646 RepID=A0ABD3GTF5_9MARC
MADEFRLVCPNFGHEGRIPRKHCAGLHQAGTLQDIAPPLEWYNVPDGTESLALIVENVAESPDMSQPMTHWVVANIPPTLKGLPEGFNHKKVEGKEEFGDIQEGVNDGKVPEYRGPAPNGNSVLEFRLYALDTKVKVGKKVTRDKLVDAMEGHILGEAILVGYGHGQEGGESAPTQRGFVSPRFPMESQSIYHNIRAGGNFRK